MVCEHCVALSGCCTRELFHRKDELSPIIHGFKVGAYYRRWPENGTELIKNTWELIVPLSRTKFLNAF